MSDDKAKEQIDRHERSHEAKALKAPDVQAARFSGHADMNRVEQARTNASDGSLRKLPADWQEQNESIQLTDGEVSISRTNPLKEADLARGTGRNANGKPYAVYSAEASQAVESIGPIAKMLSEGEYQSSVKLNVQITNVPEVSQGVRPQDLLGFTSTVIDAGARAVRPIEEHLTKPNALNDDLWNLPELAQKGLERFAQRPEQINKDAAVLTGRVLDVLDKPMSANQRAEATGKLLSMFFVEGEALPLESEVVQQMQLEQMGAQQLRSLGIERRELNMPQIPDELRDLPLTQADTPLLDAIRRHNRDIRIAEPGSHLEQHLNSMEAEASVFNTEPTEPDIILLRPEPSKISVLEEFFHGTQRTIDSLKDQERVILELHVKDFMVRHRKLLGLSDNDVEMLEFLKGRELERAEMRGQR